MNRIKEFYFNFLGLAAVLVIIVLMVTFTDSPQFGMKNDSHIVLSKNNLVVLDSEVDQASVAEVQNKARKLRACPIYLFLNTPGGSVPAGLEMFDTLKGLSCPVKTISRYAASMGFQTVQNLDERLVLQNAVLMSHRPRGQFSGEYGGKRKTAQLEKRIALSASQWEELDKIVVARTKGKQTLSSYQDAYENELWLTAKQAIEQGYADRIVTVECDSTLDGGEPINTMYQNAGISFEKPHCPLVSGPVKVQITTPGIFNAEEIKSGFLKQYNERKAPIAYW